MASTALDRLTKRVSTLETTMVSVLNRLDAAETKLAYEKGVVVHGLDPNVPRPAVQSVEWVGSVDPLNAIDGDTWIKTP